MAAASSLGASTLRRDVNARGKARPCCHTEIDCFQEWEKGSRFSSRRFFHSALFSFLAYGHQMVTSYRKRAGVICVGEAEHMVRDRVFRVVFKRYA